MSLFSSELVIGMFSICSEGLNVAVLAALSAYSLPVIPRWEGIQTMAVVRPDAHRTFSFRWIYWIILFLEATFRRAFRVARESLKIAIGDTIGCSIRLTTCRIPYASHKKIEESFESRKSNY